MSNHSLTKQSANSSLGLKKLVIAWGVLVLLGYGSMVVYSTSPAKSAVTADHFPLDSTLAHGRNLTLITFLHPQCPCSRATVSELQELLVQNEFQSNLTIYAVVSRPSGCSADFTRGAILDSLSSMKNVQVVIDKDDVESQRFGARASGQTLLFDGQGKCLFSGGITAARGEVGANAGVNALRQYLAGTTTTTTTTTLTTKQTPVFGCSLESSK
ncbi:hypothetical protein KA344_08395 [bacterium]|jgi:hypothetical protein|nr:hypothetical protein [bacterium]